jgi:hypothetical protein
VQTSSLVPGALRNCPHPHSLSLTVLVVSVLVIACAVQEREGDTGWRGTPKTEGEQHSLCTCGTPAQLPSKGRSAAPQTHHTCRSRTCHSHTCRGHTCPRSTESSSGRGEAADAGTNGRREHEHRVSNRAGPACSWSVIKCYQDASGLERSPCIHALPSSGRVTSGPPRSTVQQLTLSSYLYCATPREDAGDKRSTERGGLRSQERVCCRLPAAKHGTCCCCLTRMYCFGRTGHQQARCLAGSGAAAVHGVQGLPGEALNRCADAWAALA